MLSSCKSLENRQDGLSGDEDMLENTKPNLISFSLSTSSSNYTVSATTNSGRCDADVECSPGHVEQLTSKHLRALGEIKLPTFNMSLTSPIADPPAIPSSCLDNSVNPNLFEEKDFSICSKTDIFPDNTSIKNSAIQCSVRPSSSMCNLSDVNSLHNDMPRFASHPQLNSHQDSKRSMLTRSVSSITLKHQSHAYDHVESKVKHYIKQLKREKVKTNEHLEGSMASNVSHPEEDSVIVQLQREVERLQNYLEERDLLLKEVQANYHSLLLQYGEAKNKLDQLRFTSVTSQQAVKSVQTQSPLKTYNENSLVGPCENNQLIILGKFVNDSENWNHPIEDVTEGKMGQKESNQICQNIQLSDVDNCKLGFKSKESNELAVENSTSYSHDMARLKVSSWFSSLPGQLLPVPSCYGSLGSSGSTSNQEQDILPTGTVNGNDWKSAEPPGQSWTKNYNLRGKPHEDRVVTAAEGEDSCFPSVDKCYCWAPNNIKDCIILEGKPSIESVRPEMKDVSPEALCVPPLDLDCLNDSPIPQDSSISKHLSFSEDTSSSECFQRCSYDEKCSFKQTRVVDQMYFETPTSYKSIVIQPTSAPEGKADDKSSVLVSLCTDQQSCRKNELYLKPTNIQSNCMEGNWQKMNDQRPCCLKKIMQRCCAEDIHICCHWTKAALNHQFLRCEQCVAGNSVLPSDSQMLLNLEQFLDNMSVCAEGLRKRSEAIQSSLTNLLQSHL